MPWGNRLKGQGSKGSRGACRVYFLRSCRPRARFPAEITDVPRYWRVWERNSKDCSSLAEWRMFSGTFSELFITRAESKNENQDLITMWVKSFEKLANKRDSSACEEEELVIQDFTDHATEDWQNIRIWVPTLLGEVGKLTDALLKFIASSHRVLWRADKKSNPRVAGYRRKK